MRAKAARLLVLVHNLADNCLGRGYLLASLLKDNYDVRIAGPLPTGKSIWPPCPRDDIPIDVLCNGTPSLWALKRLSSRLTADFLIASKLRKNSFGLALMLRRRRRVPLLLDIDDWDVAASKAPTLRRWLSTLVFPWKWERLWDLSLDRMAHLADATTVATTALQERYGGALLPHVRDTHALDPGRFTGERVRRRLAVGDARIVLFLGTPRRHKGIEDVAAALRSLGRDDVRFVVVGADPRDAYVRELMQTMPFVVFRPPCTLNEAPDFLAAADVVVVPQRDTPFARSQLPAKLVDAMAMGRPTVATAVSDIQALLSGCGIVVAPGDVQGLVSALEWVLDNPDRAAEMGRRARARAVRELSYEAGRPILLRAIETAMNRYRS